MDGGVEAEIVAMWRLSFSPFGSLGVETWDCRAAACFIQPRALANGLFPADSAMVDVDPSRQNMKLVRTVLISLGS